MGLVKIGDLDVMWEGRKDPTSSVEVRSGV